MPSLHRLVGELQQHIGMTSARRAPAHQVLASQFKEQRMSQPVRISSQAVCSFATDPHGQAPLHADAVVRCRSVVYRPPKAQRTKRGIWPCGPPMPLDWIRALAAIGRQRHASHMPGSIEWIAVAGVVLQQNAISPIPDLPLGGSLGGAYRRALRCRVTSSLREVCDVSSPLCVAHATLIVSAGLS